MEQLSKKAMLECSGGAVLCLAARIVLKVLNHVRISIKAVLKWNF